MNKIQFNLYLYSEVMYTCLVIMSRSKVLWDIQVYSWRERSNNNYLKISLVT